VKGSLVGKGKKEKKRDLGTQVRFLVFDGALVLLLCRLLGSDKKITRGVLVKVLPFPAMFTVTPGIKRLTAFGDLKRPSQKVKIWLIFTLLKVLPTFEERHVEG
jgi:hypothetical protein